MTARIEDPDSTETGLPAEPGAQATLRAWIGVVILGLGVFIFTTAEMVPIGLLTNIASDLRVSEGTTGLTVTLYGVIAGVFAPILTSMTRVVNRRALLLSVLVVFIVGNAVSAWSTSFPVLIGSRLVTGFAHGLMWSITVSIAIRLVPAAAAVRATAIVFAGVSIASVIGVPLGTFIGDIASWRAAFWVIVAFGAVLLVTAFLFVPAMESESVVRLSALPSLLRRAQLRTAILVTAVVVIGHFAAYTYISPFLERISGVDRRWISVLLLAYGVAGVAGNFLSSSVITRGIRLAIVSFVLGLTASILFLVLVGTWLPGVILFLLTWGVAYAALPVALQTFVFSSAPDVSEGATSLFIMSFNVAISVGALIGGFAIDSYGPVSVMGIGIVFGALAALIMAGAQKPGAERDDNH